MPDNHIPARAPFDQDRAEAAVRELLLAVGEDPDREGLRETPARVARAYREVFAGLHEDPTEVLHKTFACLLYTSPSPRDKRQSRMPSSA